VDHDADFAFSFIGVVSSGVNLVLTAVAGNAGNDLATYVAVGVRGVDSTGAVAEESTCTVFDLARSCNFII